MRRGMTYSTILHLAVILVAFLGIPHLMRPPVEIEEPIPVEVVAIAPKTNVPKVEAKPVEQPTPPKKVETPPAPPLPTPPNPAPQKSEVPPPPQPTPPVPEPLVAALPPQPPPQPKPAKAPEPPPEPPETRTPLVPTPPKAKPTPPPQVTVESILKSVEKAKPRTEPDKADKVVKELAHATKPVTSSLDNKMTISEIDAVRRQIERCWNVPAGAKDAKNLVVDIHVVMNPDGTVREATVVDQARLQSDDFFRAAAESARRAIYLCQPLRLPPEKYSLWQDMTLSFNPSQIL
jgi:hypothetical protein